ncbi:MAG: alpha/beta fold hydrolase [Acidobacteriota bacterium]
MSPNPANASLLTHRLRGQGDETVLLLNGGMMTFRAWAPVAHPLESRYRILGCDFRGQLRTPGEAPSRLEDHLPDLLALLDHLELERVHVMGTSFGAEVALLLAARHPQRVLTLAAVTAADRTPSQMPANAKDAQRRVREVLAGGDRRAFFDAVVLDLYTDEWRYAYASELALRREQSAQLPESWYRGLLGILEAIQDFDLTPDLGRIRCPTLVVHAAKDEVMPAPRVRALAAAIPGAELRIHPTAGHVLVVEDPAWLTQVYRDFLQRRGAPAASPSISQPTPPAPPSTS